MSGISDASVRFHDRTQTACTLGFSANFLHSSFAPTESQGPLNGTILIKDPGSSRGTFSSRT